MDNTDDYTYENSGISEFFTRQEDSVVSSPELSSSSSGELNFDNIGIGGSLPDITKVGQKLRLNGITGAIEFLNDNGDIVAVAAGDLESYV